MTIVVRWVSVALAAPLAFGVGCDRRERARPLEPSTAMASANHARPSPASGSAGVAASAPTSAPAVAASTSRPSPQAAVACRTVRNPIVLPRRVPASLVARGESLLAVLDDDGHPRTLSFAAGEPRGVQRATPSEALIGSCCAGPPIPCALASDRAFCADRSGLIHRSSLLLAGDDQVVASARVGSRISAADSSGMGTSRSATWRVARRPRGGSAKRGLPWTTALPSAFRRTAAGRRRSRFSREAPAFSPS